MSDGSGTISIHMEQLQISDAPRKQNKSIWNCFFKSLGEQGSIYGSRLEPHHAATQPSNGYKSHLGLGFFPSSPNIFIMCLLFHLEYNINGSWIPSNTEQNLCKPLLFSQSAMNRVSFALNAWRLVFAMILSPLVESVRVVTWNRD